MSRLNVYAVTNDSSLEFIFSSKEKAERWVAEQYHPDDFVILEMIVDDVSEYEGCVILQE